MKKLLVIITFFICLTSVSAQEKVKLYVFTGQGCTYCNTALTYLYDHKDEYNEDVEVYTIEVWKNKENIKLFNELKRTTNFDAYLVPFFLMSNTFGKSGFSNFDGPGIIETALSYKYDDNYIDIVGNLMDKYPDSKIRTLKDTLILDGLITENNKYDDLIIISIFVIIVVMMFLFFKKGFKK